jgi:hypothetical protein
MSLQRLIRASSVTPPLDPSKAASGEPYRMVIILQKSADAPEPIVATTDAFQALGCSRSLL